MEQFLALFIRLAVMALLAAAELMTPEGGLRSATATAIGLSLVSAVASQIMGIFGAWNV